MQLEEIAQRLPDEELAKSQSPYGARWFATYSDATPELFPIVAGRNPLTGLGGLQLPDSW